MIGIIIFVFFLLLIIGLVTNIVWIAAIVGIAWGIKTGGIIGYGFAAVVLLLIAIYETNRDN